MGIPRVPFLSGRSSPADPEREPAGDPGGTRCG